MLNSVAIKGKRIMRGAIQKSIMGLVLSCCVGAIAACNGSPDTTPEATATPEATPTEQSTTTATPAPTEDGAAAPDQPAESPTTAASQNSQAAPAPKPIPPLPAECSNPQDQTAMNQCAKAEYEQADTRLNNAYQDVKASVSTAKASELMDAEDAWITFRDAYCNFVQAQYEGGSIQPMVYFGCLTQLTKNRTGALEQTTRASMSYEAADQELNSVYQDLQSYLSPADKELLTDAQLAWLDYRDAHCAFETEDLNTCLAKVTETQVNELKQQLDTRSL